MPQPKTISLYDLGIEYLEQRLAKQEARQAGRALGPATGIEPLDKELGGHLPAGVNVLMARPGAGKTAFALQVALHCNVPSLYVTVETDPFDLLERLLCLHAKVPLSRLRGEDCSPEECETALSQLWELAPPITIVDARASRADREFLQEALSDLQGSGVLPVPKNDGFTATFLVVDSLQTWSRTLTGNRPATDYELISIGVMALARLECKHPVSVLAISHRNRAGQERGGMFAGKGSGDIEYAADTLMELLPAELDSSGHAAVGELDVDLRILKNRRGPAGAVIKLKFDGDHQRFRADGGNRRRRAR